MKNFALIGAAGFVAPRHMRAIKETGNSLVVACDPNDSVGIIDQFFPQADFFTEFERFDRHVDKLKRQGEQSRVHYVSICSPNYLHDSHIRFALRLRADAVCEKPVVLNPWNLDGLEDIQSEYEKSVFTILQLRLHPTIKKLKESWHREAKSEKADIDLTYITSRGKWYLYSWKGDLAKSGGVATNIGIHFFDVLTWIFGRVEKSVVHCSEDKKMAGFIEFESARVRWLLSCDQADLPDSVRANNKWTYRNIRIDGEDLEFTQGFEDLHTQSYREILAGNGFGIADARPSIELVNQIKTATPIGLKGDYHPEARRF